MRANASLTSIICGVLAVYLYQKKKKNLLPICKIKQLKISFEKYILTIDYYIYCGKEKGNIMLVVL